MMWICQAMFTLCFEVPSVSVGLWQIVHSWVALRVPPWTKPRFTICRIVADCALLGGAASTAVDEAQIHMTGGALRSGYHLAPWGDRALVDREVVLHGLGGVGSRGCDLGA